MSLRTKIVLLNLAFLASALLAAGVAVGGVWAELAPVHRAVDAEGRAVEVAGRLGLTPAQTEAIEAALAEAREAERRMTGTALVATALPLALVALGGIACAALSLRFSRHLLGRLSVLQEATQAVARGERSVSLPAPPLPGPAGGDELDQLLGAFNRMVAQLAVAEERAREADQVKTRFFAGVSHDLRTPLTTIAGLLESLRREEWDQTTRAEFLDVAHREAQRLSRLVTDLLDLTRMESQAWPLEPEAVDLPALARSLIGDLSLPGGPLAGREVRLGGDAAATAWGDDVQLRRVLENLLTNAAKFSRPDTPITLEVLAGAAGGAVRVSVTDHGPGIDDADVAHVFDRFYRGAAHERAAPGAPGAPGTGLGLAIARSIVEAHRGRIWVEHPAGAGARLLFTVPAA
ncbi:MAG TPA: HAMP domain-containing sensor histidine kinase [Chloroflexota bacterium]|nr:HAMP domain-containing sensor histidine kinase [Chloroflexota bacterium]